MKNSDKKRPRSEPQRPVPAPSGEMLGEGNYTAARHYNEGVQKTLRTKDVEALAEDAKEALEGPEGAELRAAEKKGKEPSRGGPRKDERGPR